MDLKKIQMCDLQGQYKKIKPQVDGAIQDVIDSGAFIRGREVGLFEQELATYLGVKHVITCGNGTDALQIALMALHLKPGDEVITPDFTFIASVEIVALLGLVPVLVDVDPQTYTIDIEQLEAAITPKTRAIIPVHLFGQCANMDQIMRISQKYNIPVVEDTAQALGSDYKFCDGLIKKAGTIGAIGTTSFFPSKNLGCYGDGGALFTNDDQLMAEIRSIANHGMKVRYHHDRIGVNSRLDTIQAAILRVKLKNLDMYNQARIRAADFYDAQLSECHDVMLPTRASWSTHIFHQYTIRLQNANRAQLIEHLSKNGVPAMIYYPIPLHAQKAFAPFAEHNAHRSFAVSEMLCQTVLSLPMHTEMTDELQQFIVNQIVGFLNR